jgi:hypothetical protein
MADKPTPVPSLPPLIASSTSTTALLEWEAAKQAYGIEPGPITIIEKRTDLPPADHPIYSLVGRVASAAAHLEHTLDLIIWDLARIDHQAGACITAQLTGAQPRYRAIISILKINFRTDPRYKPFIEEVNQLLEGTHKPGDDRNRIVHDPWYIITEYERGVFTRLPSETPAQFRAMPFKGLHFGVMEIDVKNIEKTIETFIKLELRAAKLRADISALKQCTS